MSDWFSIKFNNKCVYPGPGPPVINILHGQFLLRSVLILLT